jgi:hypothetical protein
LAKNGSDRLATRRQAGRDAGAWRQSTPVAPGIGRDPATLRRSYLMFDPTARSSGGRIK